MQAIKQFPSDLFQKNFTRIRNPVKVAGRLNYIHGCNTNNMFHFSTFLGKWGGLNSKTDEWTMTFDLCNNALWFFV